MRYGKPVAQKPYVQLRQWFDNSGRVVKEQWFDEKGKNTSWWQYSYDKSGVCR
jgi:hypothetical protein